MTIAVDLGRKATKQTNKQTSKQYTVYWLRDITSHHTLFRTGKVQGRNTAEDQTLFNTIPSNEGSYEIVLCTYEIVPVHKLARK